MPLQIPNKGTSIFSQPSLNITEMERKVLAAAEKWETGLISLLEGLMTVCSGSHDEKDHTNTPIGGSGVYLFAGPHIRLVKDNGVVFESVRIMYGLQRNDRESSHVSDGPKRQVAGNTVYGGQYEVILPGGFGSILFGKSEYNGYGTHTWLQAEATSGETYSNIIWHTVVDFSLHKWSGQQVGQVGYSPYTEKKGQALIYSNDQLPPALLDPGALV